MHGMKGCDYVLKSMEKKGEILRVPVGGLLGGCVCESAIIRLSFEAVGLEQISQEVFF